ncbi:DUF4199 domain-containing protein [Flavobacterium gelidilacus]|jgi:hypothetical protein|uniref:DUF4199 domain-containing protein n=1 Tax=Flavobacterium gelidilacus TaxID=206041 RepID=UPI0004144B76|nr:DUF4199 domain-containing protein [Flavobacterium gelidilacus]
MNETIKKNGITFGIYAGVFSIAFTSFMYVYDIALFTNMWVGSIKLLVYVVIAVILLNKTKNQLINMFSFKDAFTTYFICFTICIVLATIFEVLLFNVIDPGAKDTIQENLIEFQVNMMKKMGAPNASIKEAVQKISEVNQFDVFQIIKGSAFAIAISSIFGLIFAAIFKSKPKEQF